MAAVTLAAAPTVFHAMFSGFLVFDDEGYLLLALREYAHGGVLYDEVFSQYGPAYHQVLAAVFRLAALDYVHVHGRAFVLVLWLTVGLVCAAVTYRVTRSVLLTCATQIVALQALVPCSWRPSRSRVARGGSEAFALAWRPGAPGFSSPLLCSRRSTSAVWRSSRPAMRS
jgi:hypothetical protein